MSKAAGPSREVRYGRPFQLGLTGLLFMLAFAAIFIGALLLTLGSMSNLGGASGGAIILIGPIPIVLGGGPYSFQLVELAVVLTVVAIVLFFLVTRRR
jgi:uncharacterized membrane protein